MSMRTATVLLTLVAAVSSVLINDIQPRYGSIMGGTLLTVYGDGFERGGQIGTTRLFIGNDECSIVEYWSSDNQIVCYTPPQLEKSAASELKVHVIKVDSAEWAVCKTSCMFYYRWDRTPYLTDIPWGLASNGVLKASGTFYTADLEQFEIKLAGQWCNTGDDELDPNPNVNWGRGSVQCYSPNLPAGQYNVSFAIQDFVRGGGQAFVGRRSMRADFNNNTYHVVNYPMMDSISSNSGGLLGGDSITITGAGFALNNQDNVVTLDNVPCTVTYSSASEIHCVSGARTVAPSLAALAPWPGMRGLQRSVWYGAYVTDSTWAKATARKPDYIDELTSELSVSSFGNKYAQEFTGWFMPPWSGAYSFMIMGDNWQDVAISTDESAAGLVVQATCPRATGSYYGFPEQRGGQVNLQQGRKYFFRVRHSEATGNDWVRVGMRAYSVPGLSDNQRKYMSVLASQRLQINSEVVREQQVITVSNAMDGYFVFVIGKTQSGPVPWNATNSQVYEQLRELASKVKTCTSLGISAPEITKTDGVPTSYEWTVTFNCPTAQPFPQVNVGNMDLRALPGKKVAFAGRRTVQASAPIGGTFKLNVGGQWTDDLNFDISYQALEAALERLDGITDVDVGKSGNSLDSSTFSVTFIDPVGQKPSMVFDASKLTGAGVTTSVDVQEQGNENDLLFDPIPAGYFMAPSPRPSVQITSNGVTGGCSNTQLFKGPFNTTMTNCTFDYSDLLTPTVTSVVQSTVGPISLGDTLTITGLGFSALADGNAVRLGADGVCAIKSATPTTIICTAQFAVSGPQVLEVVVFGKGSARNAPGVGQLQIKRQVFSVSPSQGSLAGGATVTIAGFGFPVSGGAGTTIGTRPCTIISANNASIVCKTPEGTGSVQVAVQGAVGTATYQYDAKYTPVITSISPSQVSAGISTMITMTGTFPSIGGELTASINSQPCALRSQTSTQLRCLLRRGVPAPGSQTTKHAPVVSLGAYGDAQVPSADTGVVVQLWVDSVSPDGGSYAGGSLVTITGAGFPTKYADMLLVYFWYGPENKWRGRCEPQSFTYNQIVCQTYEHPPPHPVNGDVPTVFDIQVNKVSAPCQGSCAFTFRQSWTPKVSSISPQTAQGGDIVTIMGENLSGGAPVLMLGHGTCDIQSQSNNQIVFKAPMLPAGSAGVHLSLLGRGKAFVSSAARLTVPLRVTSMTTLTGSRAGGTLTRVFGSGLSVNASVTFQSEKNPGKILNGTTEWLDVLTPSASRIYSSTPFGVVVTQVAVTNLGHPEDQVSTGDAHDHMGSGDSAAVTVAPGATPPPPLSALAASCPDVAKCTFTYDPSLTPSLRGVSPTDVPLYAGTVITLWGANWGAKQNTSSVTIGGVPCVVNAGTWYDGGCQCTVGNTPGGEHPVLVWVEGKGAAEGKFEVKGGLEVTQVTPTPKGSYAGGSTVTINGRGFSSGSNVTLCNSQCDVSSASYNQLVCQTRPLITPLSASTYWQASPSVLKGKAFGSGGYQQKYEMAFDGNVETEMSLSLKDCSAGFYLGPDTTAALSMIRVYPRYGRTDRVEGGKFEVSADGTNYHTVLTVDTNPQQGWTEWPIAPSSLPESVRTAASFFRFTGVDGSYCNLMEIEFQGTVIAKGSSTAADMSCPVSVSVPHDMDWFPLPHPTSFSPTPGVGSAFVFSASLTPTVTGVMPNNGTALGGTQVTLTGANFGSSSAGVTVFLHGFPCTNPQVSNNQIVCTTTPRMAIVPPTIVVSIPGKGRAAVQTNTYFRYLDRWSALTTWRNDEPPVDGDTVIVPYGQAVLLDVSTPRLNVLLVQGELIFDNVDLTVNASTILVHGGVMQIGTEAKPHMHKAVITLHGDKYKTIEMPHIGAKVLAVMNRDPGIVGAGGINIPQMRNYNPGGTTHAHTAATDKTFIGTLDIHGRPRLRTWTKVASTAAAGSNTIVTSENVDFGPGDVIVITSSTSNMYQDEMVTVASLGSDQRTITLTAPLKYTHTSNIHQIEGRTVDLRIEVGLLTRNIVIQGDDTSQSQMFGAHTMCAHSGLLRIENTEVRNCGQAGNKGRYCVHFHMSGPQHISYVKSNSIHHSFQRAVTIHGTNYLNVRDNFAYHVMGHNFFVEDGGERENVIEGNLAAHTLKLYIMLLSDVKPASFWTSTPENFWRHNVAAGCTNDGYWFELKGRPTGPSSYMVNVCPVHGHLGQFYNNTAHSNGVHGLRIYPVYLPFKEPCNPTSGPAPQYYHNFNSHHNGVHGIFGKRNGDLHHIDATLTENDAEEQLWKMYLKVWYTKDPAIKGLLAIGSLDPNKPKRSLGLTMPQDEYFLIQDVTFVNYAGGALQGCASCSTQQFLKQGGYTYRMQGLKFVNTPQRIKWSKPYKCIFHDVDGSLSGTANNFVTPYKSYNDIPGCVRSNSVHDNGHVCTGVEVRRLQIDAVEPRELDRRVGCINGDCSINFLPKELYGWVAPVAVRRQITFTFQSLVDWRSMRIRYSEPDYVVQDEWMTVQTKHIDWRWQYNVQYSDMGRRPWLEEGSSLQPTMDFGTGVMGGKYINGQKDPKVWTVLVSTNNISATGYPEGNAGGGQYEMESDGYAMRIAALQCAPGMPECSLPADIALGDKQLWSDPTTWPDGVIPAAGTDLVILPGKYIVLDINPPPLKAIRIFGKLEWSDETDITLECDSIVVAGALSIGDPRFPYQHKANIILNGQRYSPTVIVDDSLFLGNKMMAVLGRVEMYGKPRTVSWTKLATTANVGATTMTLAVKPDWVVGDSIAITTTEYDTAQTETLLITAITGATVTFTPPLVYRHFAADIKFGDRTVTLAAAVGLLTRNVVFQGALEAPNDVYGAHIVVADLPAKGKIGSVILSDVQLNSTGKQNMEHASVLFKYQTKYEVQPDNLINSVAFSNSFNYGVVGEGAQGIRLQRSVLHRHYRSAVDLDNLSVNVTITDNLVIGSYRSPDETLAWIAPQAAFYMNVLPRALSGNVATGSWDAGFTYRPPKCGKGGANFINNEAFGVRQGVYILPGGGGCAELVAFKAWKCSDTGILTVDQNSDITLDDVFVSDNYVGIALNYYNVGFGSTTLTNSIISGSTDASTCDASMTCLTYSDADRAGTSCQGVMGTTYRRTGILFPQYLREAKTCEFKPLPVCRPINTPERLCNQPWNLRYGNLGTIYSTMTMSGNLFANFPGEECNGKKSVAMTFNPTQPDFTPPVTASATSWSNVDSKAKLALGKNSLTNAFCITACDAHDMFFLQDTDGSLLGTGEPGYITPNPLLASPSPICTSASDYGGSFCPKQRLIGGTLKGLDDDAGDRRLGPIRLTRLMGGGKREATSVGPYKEMCAIQMHFMQFALAFSPGEDYELIPSGNMPKSARLYFYSKDPRDVVKVNIFYTKADTLVVFLGNTRLDSVGRMVNISDAAGAYVQDPQARRLHLVMRGNSQSSAYTIRTLPLVQLTMTLAVEVNEFYSDRLVEHMSLLLGIDPDTIKVVEVHAGSTVIVVQIRDSKPVPADDTLATEQVVRLQNVAREVVTKFKERKFSVGYDVLDLQVKPPTLGDSDVVEGIPTGSVEQDPQETKNMVPAIVGGLFGSLAFVGLLLGGLFLYRRRRGSFNIETMGSERMVRRKLSHQDEPEGLAERECLPPQVREAFDEDDSEEVGVRGGSKAARLAQKTKIMLTPKTNQKVHIDGDVEAPSPKKEKKEKPLGKGKKVHLSSDGDLGMGGAAHREDDDSHFEL